MTGLGVKESILHGRTIWGLFNKTGYEKDPTHPTDPTSEGPEGCAGWDGLDGFPTQSSKASPGPQGEAEPDAEDIEAEERAAIQHEPALSEETRATNDLVDCRR